MIPTPVLVRETVWTEPSTGEVTPTWTVTAIVPSRQDPTVLVPAVRSFVR